MMVVIKIQKYIRQYSFQQFIRTLLGMNSSQSTSKRMPQFGLLSHGPELYQAVIKYSTLTMLPDLRLHDSAIRKYLQTAQLNTLFIFGPSGCGKRTLVKNHLNRNKIPYKERAELNIRNNQNYEFDEEERPYRIISVREQIEETLQQNWISHVDIFEEFPVSSAETSSKENVRNALFKKNYFQKIHLATCKSIFMLNTQIYNPYYILPKDLPHNIMIITLKSYTNGQMKSILKDFCSQFPVFQYILKKKDELQQILQLSNGDARKVFLNIYQNYINLGLNKFNYGFRVDQNCFVDPKLQMKNERRFPLFHLLGKYLYAKRYDVQTKTDRCFSRIQLMKSDPPFYFNPVETYNRSLIPMNTFIQLLFENYPTQFGNMSDIREVSQMFVLLNSRFPTFIINKRIDGDTQNSKQLYLSILTWGIILKNKSNSLVNRKFKKFRKSSSISVIRDMNNKKQLIRKYFKNWPAAMVIKMGYFARNMRTTRKYLACNLLLQRNKLSHSVDEQNGRISQEEEQSLARNERGIDENQLRKQIKVKMQQKQVEKRILEFQDDLDSEYSDIDEEENT